MMYTNFKSLTLSNLLLVLLLSLSSFSYGQKNLNVVLNEKGSMKIKFSNGGFYMYISPYGKVQNYGVSGDSDVTYDFNGRIQRIGDMSLDFDFNGRIKTVGSFSISYDFHDRVQNIGSTSFSYNFDDVISSIGTKTIQYDFHDRVTSIGGTTISYGFISEKIDNVSNNDGFVIVEYEIK